MESGIKGAKKYSMDRDFDIEMIKAIDDNRLDQVKVLLATQEELLNHVTVYGTWVEYTVRYGTYEMLKYFIEDCGLDVNKKGKNDYLNALGYAAEKGRIEMMKLLCEHGAEIELDEMLKNPFFAAIRKGHLPAVKFFVERGIDLTTKYAGYGHSEKIVDCVMHAKIKGQQEIVSYLEKCLNIESVEEEKVEEPVIPIEELVFDYDQFEQDVYAFVEEYIRKWSAEKKDIYGFSIDCSPEYDWVRLIANTETYLQTNMEKSTKEEYFYYRFHEEEWELWGESDEIYKCMDTYKQRLWKSCGEDDELWESRYTEHKQKIQESCIKVLKKIKTSEVYQLISGVYLNFYIREQMREADARRIFTEINGEGFCPEYIDNAREFTIK